VATLLIVDDDAGILSALRRSLRREGWNILLAGSPSEALEIIDQNRVDLILSDHKMPGMTGTELLGEVSRRSPETVRILITGWSEAIDEEELARIGVGAMVSKPWDGAELKSVLRQYLA